jgi:uncharacterized membrane protein
MPLVFLALDGLFRLAILVGIGFLVYAAARALFFPAPAAQAAADPLALAAARYARGEIGRDEYLQIRSDLAAPGAVERP